MATFKPRTTAPAATNKYYIHYKFGGYNIAKIINAKTGYVMANCVGYSYGRWLECQSITKCDWKLPACNPIDFFNTAVKNGKSTGQSPRLGAIAVWDNHVANVEHIDESNNFDVSQSHFNGAIWDTIKILKKDNYTYYGHKFLGFVYTDIDFGTGDYKPIQEVTPVAPTIVAGKKISLNNTPCFNDDYVKTPYQYKTGTFYLWDDKVTGVGRIRITNKPERVGVKGQVTCFINASDVK